MNRILKFLFFSSFCFCAQAQETVKYSTPKEYEIAGISVSGVQYLDNSALIHISGLAVEQKITIPGDKISSAIDKLWKQGLFENIQIKIVKFEGNRVFLDIYLEERPLLSRIEYEGLKKSNITKFEDDIPFKENEVVTDYKINQFKQVIKKSLVEKSYLNATVDVYKKADTAKANSLVLVVKVDKKSKVKIETIEVEGNNYVSTLPADANMKEKFLYFFNTMGNEDNKLFSDAKVRKKLKKTKQVNPWRFYKKSKYVPANFKEDLKDLEKAYSVAGFRDMRVISDSIYTINDKRIGVKLKIFEGKPYYFGNITFVGNKKYTNEHLFDVLNIKKGEVYNEEKLNSNLVMNRYGPDIYALYFDDGYLTFNAQPVETNVYNDTVDLEIRIYEGRQSRFNEISVVGNTRTNDHVVIRETRTVPGQLFSRTDLINSVNDLRQLRFFNDQTLDPKPIPLEDGSANVEFHVEEVGSDQLELSGGWGGGMVVGTIGIAFNNFSVQNIFKKDRWKPLPSGDGQKLSLRVQSNGTYYYTIAGSFTEPWLGGRKPLSLSVSANHSMNSTNTSKGDDRYGRLIINGLSVGLGKRLTWPDDFFTLYQSISYQQYNMYKYEIIQGLDNGTSNNISYSISLSRQSMDAALFPKTGSSLSLTVQATPPYSLFNDRNYAGLGMSEKYKWLEFYKVSFKAGWYFNPIANLVFNARFRVGFLGFYNEEVGYPPFERFYLGGDGLSGFSLDGRELIGMRGYTNNSLSGDYGATAFEKITMEARYPVTTNPAATIYALTFFEAGNSWEIASRYNPFTLYRSAGVGLRLYLAGMGMFGLDWGYGFDEVPGNPNASKGQLHFSINQSLDW